MFYRIKAAGSLAFPRPQANRQVLTTIISPPLDRRRMSASSPPRLSAFEHRGFADPLKVPLPPSLPSEHSIDLSVVDAGQPSPLSYPVTTHGEADTTKPDGAEMNHMDFEPPGEELAAAESSKIDPLAMKPAGLEPIGPSPIGLEPLNLKPKELRPVDWEPVDIKPTIPDQLEPAMDETLDNRLTLQQASRSLETLAEVALPNAPSGDPEDSRISKPEDASTAPSTGAGEPETDTTGSQATKTSLSDLFEAFQMDQIQLGRTRALEAQLHSLFRECGTNARLIPIQSHLYRLMALCVRDEEKSLFTTLYSQSLSVHATCGSGHGPPLLNDVPSAIPHPDASWINRLPDSSQAGVLSFLSNLRRNPAFLADRIVRLPSPQLMNLARPHRVGTVLGSPRSSTESVFAKFGSRTNLQESLKSQGPVTSLEQMLRDPLLLLVHGVFGTSSPSSPSEELRRLDIWSSVLARVIESGKLGADDFCLAVIGCFPTPSCGSSFTGLERFLLNLIRCGDQNINLLTSASSSGPAFSLDLDTKDPAAASQNFNGQATELFLDLLLEDDQPFAASGSSLDLVRAGLEKIENYEKRAKARSFFVSRWFCSRLLGTALVTPESHGVLLGCHISSDIRQKILSPLASNLCASISDALSQGSLDSATSSTKAAKSQKVLRVFDAPSSLKAYGSPDDQASLSLPFLDKGFVSLGSREVLSIVTALVPSESSESRNSSTIKSLASVATSVTASSTLTAGTSDGRTGTASSVAPSLSGTSMTSATFANEASASTLQDFHRYPGKEPPEDQSTSNGVNIGSTPSNSSDLSLGFLPDLWKLAMSQEGSTIPQQDAEQILLFVNNQDGSLSLDPLSPASDRLNEPSQPQDVVEVLGHSPLGQEEYVCLCQGVTRLALHASLEVRENIMRGNDELSSLKATFDALMRQAHFYHDFQTSHFWWTCAHAASKLTPDLIRILIETLFQSTQAQMERARHSAHEHQDWISVLQARKARQLQYLQASIQACESMRDKMWYLSDVRNSSIYEETLNVVRALKDMAAAPKPKETGVAAWAKHKFRNSFGQERLRAQVLDAMLAPRDRGGQMKLADSQVTMTSRWLVQDSIENFCRGEERIHRFCFEIHKAIKKCAGESLLDSPVLWSSALYEYEKQIFFQPRGTYPLTPPMDRAPFRSRDQYSGSAAYTAFASNASVTSDFPRSSFNIAGSPYGSENGLGLQNGYSRPGSFQQPGLNGQAWPLQPQMFPPSPVSPSTARRISDLHSRGPKRLFVEKIRENLTSLILSDFGLKLWRDGSETDRWIKDEPLLGKLEDHFAFHRHGSTCSEAKPMTKTENVSPTGTQRATDDTPQHFENDEDQKVAADLEKDNDSNSFGYEDAFRKLLQSFSLAMDPRSKLQALHELVLLAAIRVQASRKLLPSSELDQDDSGPQRLSSGIPRTRLTWLQEVAANCEERRFGSLTDFSPSSTTALADPILGISVTALQDSALISGIQTIILDPAFRPPTFFRDLQFIAAFVSSNILDHTPAGTAFWTVGLAACALKSRLASSLTDAALQILAHHYADRSVAPTTSGSPDFPSPTGREPTRCDSGSHSSSATGPAVARRPLAPELLAGTTLADAARLYTRAALEGDPTAARELGLFYLTHPELVPRVTLPLSKPSEVFGPVASAPAPAGPAGATATVSNGVGVLPGSVAAGPPERKAAGHTKSASEGDAPKPAAGASGSAGGLDPGTFAVAFHWMEFAANAGDADAITFFRENMELGQGW